MVSLSRSFIRRRVISLATTTTVMATSLALADPTRPHHGGNLVPIHYVTGGWSRCAHRPLLAQNRAVPNKIVAAGDVDHDLVDMMVWHHRAAIEMAEVVLRFGHDERARRLAQEIVVPEPREIVAMRIAVGEEPRLSMASSTEPGAPAPSHDSMKMIVKE